MKPRVELVYLTGCPHVEAARQRLRMALQAAGWPIKWREWNSASPDTPDEVRGFGSPTILVDGRDVTGGTPGAGMGCAVAGAPPVETIAMALARGWP